LQLTGLENAAGGAITLAEALVTECKTEYREGQIYRVFVKACWWE
jgi:hypothetical protein